MVRERRRPYAHVCLDAGLAEVRAKAFASLYGDPEWMEIRRKTNGSREMVLKYDIYLMHGSPVWDVARQLHAARSGPADGLHELRIYDLYPGKNAQANKAMSEIDLPALKKAGATTLGVFDVQSGPELPAYVHIMRWDNYEARSKGLKAYDADPAVVATRKAEADELNTYVLGHHNTWLLEPTDFRMANYGLA